MKNKKRAFRKYIIYSYYLQYYALHVEKCKCPKKRARILSPHYIYFFVKRVVAYDSLISIFGQAFLDFFHVKICP